MDNEKIHNIFLNITKYITNKCNKIKNTKPNVGNLWEEYLTMYSYIFFKELDKLDDIINNNYINNDIPIETIRFLYMMNNIDFDEQ